MINVKKVYLFGIEIFCNIIIFTIAFDHFNAFFLESLNFVLTPNF